LNQDNIDLGNMKSRDVGNMISKGLVDLGKDAVQNANPDEVVDYGDLPSRTLAELGKQAVVNNVQQGNTE
jgi:hypothetical protein